MGEKKVCYHCFQELSEEETVCSRCGFDPEKEKEKYPHALPYGTILNGRYITGHVLGQGGFGITYVARDWKEKRLVAIKEYLPEQMASRTGSCSVTAYSGQNQENFIYGKECFMKEAQVMSEFIGIPGIVQVYQYFEENGTAYFVMDYVEGISFQTYIKNHGGRISWEEAERILLPVMNALEVVHKRGVIHRDVTPDNIYLTGQNEVKLLDFGAARYSLGDKSRSLDIVLKHGYAPKEQYTRHGRQGPYTDVYSVAASFYTAITGRKLPDAIDRLEQDDLIPPSTCGSNIPKEKEDAILKALEVQPADRFQNMKDFREALMGTVPVPEPDPQPDPEPKPDPQPDPGPKPVPKWLIPVIGGCAVLILIVGVLLGKGGGNNETNQKANQQTTQPSASSTQAAQSGEITGEADSTTASQSTMSGTYDAASGNLNNWGLVVSEGNDIYFAINNKLFKNQNGEKNNTLLFESGPGGIRSMNLVDDWIYYIKSSSGVYRIKTDGTGAEELVSDRCNSIYVNQDYLYESIDEGGIYSLYRIPIGNWSRKEKIMSGMLSYFTVAGDWIYYWKKEGYDLYRMHLDGTNDTRLSDTLGFRPCIKDDWVYFSTTKEIYKITTDGSSETKLYEVGSDASISNFNVTDEKCCFEVYYKSETNQPREVWCINQDGSVPTKLFTANNVKDTIFGINVKDDVIYLHYIESGEGSKMYSFNLPK